MSYILDALRKSETERRQGKVPDLGQQVQLIHRPKKRKTSPVVWMALALLVNAAVLAVVFWPDGPTELTAVQTPQTSEPAKTLEQPVKPGATPEAEVAAPASVNPEPVSEPVSERESAPVPARERPLIITPSVSPERRSPALRQDEHRARVPHLVELPLSFQKSIPDLMFNSHIYSTDPYASRVMINGHYMRQGESFSGITVEEITEEGVVLSKQDRTFRVGVVRDWVSPD